VTDHKAVTIYDTVSKVLANYGHQIENVGVINTDNASANIKAFRYVFNKFNNVFFSNEQFSTTAEVQSQQELETEDEMEQFSSDDEAENEIEDDEDEGRTTDKWIGCANHTLQLALKILDSNSKFSNTLSVVTRTLSHIRKSANAVRDFSELTNRCIKLPNATR